MIENNAFFCKKKENFMEDQKLEQTTAALGEMKESLNALMRALDAKRNTLAQQKENYKNNVTEKNAEIEKLKQALSMAAQKIEKSALKIDEVIKENGSGNN